MVWMLNKNERQKNSKHNMKKKLKQKTSQIEVQME